MATAPHLIDRLPRPRGRLSAHAPLAQRTWFRVGGPAEVLFRPVDVNDLSDFVGACPADVPVTVIGAASNLLIRDGGIPGIVIRTAGLSAIHVDGDTIEAGAGALDATVADTAAEHGLTGLEFLSGIPGTIGGAVAMNAGCYGREISDVVHSAVVVMTSGEMIRLSRDELGLAYRHSSLPEGAIVVSATLRGMPGDKVGIDATMARIREERTEAQPVRARTGGSTFANPPGHKAWQLVDRAGCRGLAIGGALVSDKHCNFLINAGDARAADLEALGEEVRRRVFETSGIDLRWEIRRVGVAG